MLEFSAVCKERRDKLSSTNKKTGKAIALPVL
jgi:hypothetical protein